MDLRSKENGFAVCFERENDNLLVLGYVINLMTENNFLTFFVTLFCIIVTKFFHPLPNV